VGLHRRRRGSTRLRVAAVTALALAAGGVVGATQALAATISTTLTLTASPASPQPVGTTVLFKVSISPTTVPGTVLLFDGGTLLGSAQHYESLWSLTTSTLAAGTHSLTATFTPDNTAAYGGSSTTGTYVISGGSGGGGGTPTPTPTPTPTTTTSSSCTVSAKEVPSCGVLWGAYKPTSGSENWQTAVTDLESQVGRPFDIVYRYQDFSTGSSGTFPDSNEQALASSGHILLADWAAKNFSTGAQIPWANIANGSYDASVIDPEAQRIKSYGKPIMVSFDHEMDSRVGTSQGTAANYVAAYKHIHDEFARLGVTNVIWVWTVTGSSNHDSQYASLYPGNSYVDWIGFDPYNFYTCHGASNPWKTFDQTVSQPYQWFESNGFGVKPFILPEYGTVPNPSNTSAAATWYTQLPSTLLNYPNIKALIQWDSQTGSCNVQLTASTGELAAFAAAGKTTSIQSHVH
jgi:hypothetical protein